MIQIINNYYYCRLIRRGRGGGRKIVGREGGRGRGRGEGGREGGEGGGGGGGGGGEDRVLLTFVPSPSVFHRGPRHSETSCAPPRESLPEPIGSGSPVHNIIATIRMMS